MKGNAYVLKENPQPCLDPPYSRMARWPKTPGDLGNCISAESVRTIRKGKRVVFVMCTVGEFIGREDNVKSE